MNVDPSINEWEQRRRRLLALIGPGPSQQQYDPPRSDQIMDYQLYTAAKKGEVDNFIDVLEDHCKNKNVWLPIILQQCSPSKNTLLHTVAESDDIVKAIIKFVPEHLISLENSSGETPLHIAARARKTLAVELLLPQGRPRATNRSGNSALHEAVRSGCLEVIGLLVSKDPYPLYCKNKESKSPWCIAVETGDLDVLKLLLEAQDPVKKRQEAPRPVKTENLLDEADTGLDRLDTEHLGLSPAHVAVMYQKMDMLRKMWEKKPWLFQLRDEGNGTPLHFAAYTNYLDGVQFLIDEIPLSALEQDKEGYLPIHIVCMMDHVRIVQKLLGKWQDPVEFQARGGENILHVSARYGCISTVKYILKSPEFKHLINARNFDGNTPLHLATLHWQPSILLLLARDERVDLKLPNYGNMTALDVVEEDMKEMDAPLRKKITWIILASAGTPRSGELAICRGISQSLGKEMQPPELDRLKQEANTRMVIAALVAGITFASGFSVPGGYNGSGPDAGIAVLLHKAMYNVFVICNSIAMYSSIIALVILLWTQINDPHMVENALSKSRLPLLVTLAAMPLAFMAGVYVSITKLAWLAIVVLVLGSVALCIILSFYLMLYIPLGHNHPLVRRFTDLIIVVGISMSGSVTAGSGSAGRATTTPRAMTTPSADRGFDDRLYPRSLIPRKRGP